MKSTDQLLTNNSPVKTTFISSFDKPLELVLCVIGPEHVESAPTELDEVLKSSSEPDFVGLANQRLVSTLTKNLANMEHFSRRDAVSLYFTLTVGFSLNRK